MWRIVLDPRIPDGLADMRAHWTLDDMWRADELLDQLDAIDARAAIKAGVGRV